MDDFEQFKKFIQQDIDNAKEKGKEIQNVEKAEKFLNLFLNRTEETNININIDQRLNYLNGLEDSEKYLQEKNRIAQSIDLDVRDCFMMIKNKLFLSKRNDANKIIAFFNEIDELIRTEETLISVYTKSIQITGTNYSNFFKKRILLLISEKSKVYHTFEGKFFVTDDERKKMLEKFEGYLQDIQKTEKTYIPPKFNKVAYEALNRRIHTTKKILIAFVLVFLIIAGWWLFKYQKEWFGKFIVFIPLLLSLKQYYNLRVEDNKIRLSKQTRKEAKDLWEDIMDKTRNNKM